MGLELFNNLFNGTKENGFVQNFIKELSGSLQKNNQNNKSNQNSKNVTNLKEEGNLYQVVDMGIDSVFLQDTKTNKVFEEKDISKNLLDKIGNDTILKYENGKYVIEKELTEKFLDSLVDIKEFKKIQEDFIKESNILNIDSNTIFKIQSKENNYSILSYENGSIKVPNALIPFWTEKGDGLYFKNNKFNRKL